MGEVLNFNKDDVGGGLDPADFRDTMGRFRTQSLFKEMTRSPAYPAYFTLKDKDTSEHVSMRRLYLAIGDPTEYETAIALLGDFKHWQALCDRPWFMEHLIQWRIELENKIESEAIESLRKTAANPKSSSRVTAAKALLEKPWRSKDNLRGRPSKDEMEGYKKQAAKETSDIEEDAARLFGEKNNGA